MPVAPPARLRAANRRAQRGGLDVRRQRRCGIRACCAYSRVVAKHSRIAYPSPMHVALVMNTAWGVKTLRSDLIRFLQSLRHHVSVVSPADAATVDLQRMGVTFQDWAVARNGLNPLREGLAILRLRRLFAGMKPDVILCFTPKAILLGSLAARATPSSHVFSIFTGLGFLFADDSALKRTLAPFIHFMFRRSIKNNHVVFFQNPDDLSVFVTNRIVPLHRTCRLYGSGVDTKRFLPGPSNSGRGETVFLMIARLLSAKGVLDYIEAAKILRHQRCNARCRLLGPFDDHPTAVDRDTIQSAVDSGAIEYCGTTSDVRPYLRDADVFVLPSYYREGTPRSSLEALATAKPIITTDWPGCRETVVHDSNGYLVPVRDPVALAEAMRKLVGDRDHIRAMGSRSRELAEELYDVDKVNAHLWREISRVLDPTKSPDTERGHPRDGAADRPP